MTTIRIRATSGRRSVTVCICARDAAGAWKFHLDVSRKAKRQAELDRAKVVASSPAKDTYWPRKTYYLRAHRPQSPVTIVVDDDTVAFLPLFTVNRAKFSKVLDEFAGAGHAEVHLDDLVARLRRATGPS